MQNLQSRLQSRLAKRRNVIRQVEEDVFALRHHRRVLRVHGIHHGIDEVNYALDNASGALAELADDQKLDKQLKNLTVYAGHLGFL